MTFDEWVEQRLEPLLRFAAVLCGSRQLAEDVVQEVLIKAHRHWERVQAADRPDSYLRRMVVNEYLSWRRRWSRVVPRPEITVTDQHSDPASGLADRQELLAELAKLPRRQRTVLVLRYYEGYTDAEAVRGVVQGQRTATRSVGRRRMLVASAAVLTAVAIAVPLLFRSTGNAPVTVPSTPLPDAPWRHSFHLQLPNGYQYDGLDQHQLYRDREETDIQPPQGSGCIVEVYRRGAFDPSVIPPGATPVTVNGNPGYFADFTLPSDWIIDRPPRIAWRYATDSWAVTSCKDADMTDDLRGNEQTISESVVFERHPFLVPFTVGYLPDGFHVQQATAKRPHTWTVTPGQPRIPERYPPLVTISASRDGDADQPDAHTVAIAFRQDDLTVRATADKSVTVNGRPAFLRSDRFGTTLVIPGDGYEFAVGVRAGVLGTPAQTEQQLVAVAEGLRLAERPLDDTTWFDGSTALAF